MPVRLSPTQRLKLVLYFTVKASKETHKQRSPTGDRKTVAGAVAMVAELGIDELHRRSNEIRAGWRKKP
jgi:hypothetical protein